jgi:hypothetical protein
LPLWRALCAEWALRLRALRCRRRQAAPCAVCAYAIAVRRALLCSRGRQRARAGLPRARHPPSLVEGLGGSVQRCGGRLCALRHRCGRAARLCRGSVSGIAAAARAVERWARRAAADAVRALCHACGRRCGRLRASLRRSVVTAPASAPHCADTTAPAVLRHAMLRRARAEWLDAAALGRKSRPSVRRDAAVGAQSEQGREKRRAPHTRAPAPAPKRIAAAQYEARCDMRRGRWRACCRFGGLCSQSGAASARAALPPRPRRGVRRVRLCHGNACCVATGGGARALGCHAPAPA